MSVKDVEQAIKQVQPHIAAYQLKPPRGRVNYGAPANNHEHSTRYIIIDPILRALGWDLSDPEQCVAEYPVEKRRHYPAKRVDYVLKDRNGTPVIVVEAKKISVDHEDEDAIAQVERYLEDIPDAMVAVITNGHYWTIVIRDGEKWNAESGKPLGLHYHKTGENAKRLWDSIGREPLNDRISGDDNSFGGAVRSRRKR